MSINVLSFTTLYPNDRQPRHGIFVEQRLRQLIKATDIQLKVVAPVPWFPLKSKCFGQYSIYSKVEKNEDRFGIDVYHPNYLVIPKVGMSITPLLLAVAGLKKIKELIKNGFKPDIIDAHYVYPDGVAAALIGKWLNIPVVITARGSDINILPKYALPKKMILWATKEAAMNITVSRALKTEMQKLGVPVSDIEVLRNGVDLEIFNILPDVRKGKCVKVNKLISVGNLIELKGHHLIIEALINLVDSELTIVGEGPNEIQLKQLAVNFGVDNRVNFVGYKTHKELVRLYNEVDALILASSREGMPNVLLEAMACGTPVITTMVGGAVEVVTEVSSGILLKERSVGCIEDAVNDLMSCLPLESKTREYAEQFSWDTTISKLKNRIESSIQK
jgi:teichuronic acid biosynthesis glycosyltransferase TuaC